MSDDAIIPPRASVEIPKASANRRFRSMIGWTVRTGAAGNGAAGTGAATGSDADIGG